MEKFLQHSSCIIGLTYSSGMTGKAVWTMSIDKGATDAEETPHYFPLYIHHVPLAGHYIDLGFGVGLFLYSANQHTSKCFSRHSTQLDWIPLRSCFLAAMGRG